MDLLRLPQRSEEFLDRDVAPRLWDADRRLRRDGASRRCAGRQFYRSASRQIRSERLGRPAAAPSAPASGGPLAGPARRPGPAGSGPTRSTSASRRRGVRQCRPSRWRAMLASVGFSSVLTAIATRVTRSSLSRRRSVRSSTTASTNPSRTSRPPSGRCDPSRARVRATTSHGLEQDGRRGAGTSARRS